MKTEIVIIEFKVKVESWGSREKQVIDSFIQRVEHAADAITDEMNTDENESYEEEIVTLSVESVEVKP